MCWLPWVCTRALFSCGRRGLLSRCPLRLLADVPFLRALGLLRVGSARGIFPDQESNQGPLHCKGILSHWTTTSVQFSRSVVSDSLWPHEPQHARPPCPSPTPGVYSNSGPSSRWCHPAISSSLSSLSPPAPSHSQHQGLFQWVNSSHEVAKVLEFQLKHQSFQWTPRTDLL